MTTTQPQPADAAILNPTSLRPQPHRRPVLALAIPPDDGRVCLHDLAAGKLMATLALDYPIRCLAVAPAGVLCYAGDEAGNLYAVEFRT